MKITITGKNLNWIRDFLLGESSVMQLIEKAFDAFRTAKEGEGVLIEDRENKITVSIEGTEMKALFHLQKRQGSVGYIVWMKEVKTNEELIRSEDMGNQIKGIFKDRYEALERINELAQRFGEFAIFE